MTAPVLSVIVLTHNRLSALTACVEAIRRNTHTLFGPYELIVVDNGSTDGTLKHLGPAVDMMISLDENKGVCARNYGIERATAPIIAQVDDDVLVHPGWATILLAAFDDAKVGGAGQHGFYRQCDWEPKPWSAGLIDDRRRPSAGQYADLLMGFCWAWRNIGVSYDWDFGMFWHEESDLQFQIRSKGYRLMVTPDIATHRSLHPWGETVGDGPHSLAQAERNFNLLKSKWKDADIPCEAQLVGL